MHRPCFLKKHFRTFLTLSTCLTFSALLFLPGVASADEIVVAAAISLKKPFELIAKDLETKSDIRVKFNFAASGILAQQILHGAPVDVYAPASELELSMLKTKGLIAPGDVKQLAVNTLVIVASSSSTLSPGTSILNSGKRIAIGNPNYTPAGRYAVQALKHLGAFDNLVKANKLVYAENVKQALTYAENGSVDAAIVYGSDAVTSAKVRVLHQFAQNDTETISYPIAIIGSSSHRESAQVFLQWCDTPSASAHLKQAGFLPKPQSQK